MEREQAVEAAREYRQHTPDTRIYLYQCLEVDDWMVVARLLTDAGPHTDICYGPDRGGQFVWHRVRQLGDDPGVPPKHAKAKLGLGRDATERDYEYAGEAL